MPGPAIHVRSYRPRQKSMEKPQQKQASPSGKLQLPNLSAVGSPLSTPLASPRREMASHGNHRQSFASDRGIPSSPRQRNPSLSQQAIQDLINNPPVARGDDSAPRFAGRDWRSIALAEIIAPDEVRFVEADTTVEAATKVYLSCVYCLSYN